MKTLNKVISEYPNILRVMEEAAIAAGKDIMEVYVNEQIETRDVKGLYAKVRSGHLKNFTGIDSPYDAPETPEIHIDTTTMSIDEAAEKIVKQLMGE